MSSEVIECIFGTAGIAGGIYFIVLARVGKTNSAQWVRTAYLLLGILSVAWGTIVILTIPRFVIFNKTALIVFDDFKPFGSGIAVGVILTLAIAGQVKPSVWKW